MVQIPGLGDMLVQLDYVDHDPETGEYRVWNFVTEEYSEPSVAAMHVVDLKHLPFGEQDGDNSYPCVCWSRGNAGIGVDDEQQHPEEWREGAQAAYERLHDI